MPSYQFPNTSSGINVDDHLNDFLVENDLLGLHSHVWPARQGFYTVEDDMDHFRGKWGFYFNAFVTGSDTDGSAVMFPTGSVRFTGPAFTSSYAQQYQGGITGSKKVFLYDPYPSASFSATGSAGFVLVRWASGNQDNKPLTQGYSNSNATYSTNYNITVPYNSNVNTLYAVFERDCTLDITGAECDIKFTALQLTPAPTPAPTAAPTASPTASPTAAPVTPAPTPEPTAAPVTPAPTPSPTASPVTPAPVTPAPVTPEPTAAPVTPAPVTPAPVTPAPVTPEPTAAPVTPAPVTPAPVTPSPTASPTPAPVLPTGNCYTVTYSSVPSDLSIRYRRSSDDIVTTDLITSIETMNNGDGTYTAGICVSTISPYNTPVFVQGGVEVGGGAYILEPGGTCTANSGCLIAPTPSPTAAPVTPSPTASPTPAPTGYPSPTAAPVTAPTTPAPAGDTPAPTASPISSPTTPAPGYPAPVTPAPITPSPTASPTPAPISSPVGSSFDWDCLGSVCTYMGPGAGTYISEAECLLYCSTPAPVSTPSPTAAPVTPSPTPAPVTPAPATPAPGYPAPVTPSPTASPTPAPVTPAPVTPAPVEAPTPAPVTPSPTATPAPASSFDWDCVDGSCINAIPGMGQYISFAECMAFCGENAPVVTEAPVTPSPTASPTASPVTPAPTPEPTAAPVTPAPVTPSPTASPTPSPTAAPTTPSPAYPAPVTPAPITPAPVTPSPTPEPTAAPVTPAPTPSPTAAPVTPAPTPSPTAAPVTPAPTPSPTAAPVTPAPTPSPTAAPVTPAPYPAPTMAPTASPTASPTAAPVTPAPTPEPTAAPVTPAPTPAPIQVYAWDCVNGVCTYVGFGGIYVSEASCLQTCEQQAPAPTATPSPVTPAPISSPISSPVGGTFFCDCGFGCTAGLEPCGLNCIDCGENPYSP